MHRGSDDPSDDPLPENFLDSSMAEMILLHQSLQDYPVPAYTSCNTQRFQRKSGKQHQRAMFIP
jgi:hypothetical protein